MGGNAPQESEEDGAILEGLGLAEPEDKRRRTQEEEDWNDDFWKDDDVASRDIDLVERHEIEGRVDRWIQEIEEVVEESLRHQEELDLEDLGGAWDDVHGAGGIPLELVKESRREEVELIEGKPVWILRT
eukprot:3873118-Karenia_brevis.AAC.1